MVDKKPDFIVQAALLDKYIRTEDPSSDPIGVSVVIRKIKESPDLLRHFLGQNPSFGWAQIFYDNGFFNNPPSVIEIDNGFQTPYWALSAYLNSVANKTPEIVEKVVSEIETNNPVIQEDLLRALSKLSISKSIVFVPKIRVWLNNKYVVFWGLAEAAINLTLLWAEAGYVSQAMDLLAVILEPVPSSVTVSGNYYFGGTGRPRVELDYVKPNLWSEAIPRLAQFAYFDILKLLENKLLECIRVEMSAQHKQIDFSSGVSHWWRTSIADHEQNYGTDYKDKILVSFRNLLDDGVKKYPNRLRQIIIDYLENNVVILKRIGIYIVANNSDAFIDLAGLLLENEAFHSDLSFHNDYFQLLALTYSLLPGPQQEKVLGIMRKGPSTEIIDNARIFAASSGYNVDKYLNDQKGYWIRDRLWVIKQYLAEDAKQELNDLCVAYGAPDHPGFLTWSSGGFWIRDISPLPKEQLSALSPNEFFDFIKSWRENQTNDFGPMRTSMRGLGEVVAEIILDAPEKYEYLFENLHEVSPSISSALFSLAHERLKKNLSLPWAGLIKLILSCSEISQKLREENVEGALDARLEGIRLLQNGLTGSDTQKVLIPVTHFDDVKKIIQIYLEDSHPNLEQDRPSENMMGHRDPLTVSLNSVRPIAFTCFMELVRHTDVDSDWGMSLQVWAKKHLERKLDKDLEPSLAVHSIFGRYYWLLFKWDADWLQKNISRIFPLEHISDSIDYFLAAWDSYIIYNRPNSKIIKLLRHEYVHSVNLLSEGKITKTHLDIAGRMFIHIFLDFMWNPYDLYDQESLLKVFINQCNDTVRSQAVHSLCDLMRNVSRSEMDTLWPKIREFWLWRVNEFSLSQYPGESGKEIQSFSLLSTYAPSTEKIEDMQVLINPLLNSIKDGFVWRNLEKLLSLRVDSEPVQVAKIYRMMHENIVNSASSRFISYGEEADKIIHSTIKNAQSRKDALSTIDIIYRNGHSQYRDLYEKYA